MTVEIPPEFQQFVQSIISRGAYKSEAEVVGAALSFFQERDRRLRELQQEVRPALERLDQGKGIELDDQSIDAFFEDVKDQGRMRLEGK